MKRFALGVTLGLVFGVVLTASANVGSFFVHAGDLTSVSNSVANAYAAGVYDAVSELGYIAQNHGGLNTTALVATVACLDNKGETVSEFGQWAMNQMRNASARQSGAVALISACIP